jgi:hypothetical protein
MMAYWEMGNQSWLFEFCMYFENLLITMKLKFFDEFSPLCSWRYETHQAIHNMIIFMALVRQH